MYLGYLAYLAKLAKLAFLTDEDKYSFPYLINHCLNIISLTVQLVGGEQGNLHAKNPKTGIFGPVCDDTWNMKAVSTLFGTAYILLL